MAYRRNTVTEGVSASKGMRRERPVEERPVEELPVPAPPDTLASRDIGMKRRPIPEGALDYLERDTSKELLKGEGRAQREQNLRQQEDYNIYKTEESKAFKTGIANAFGNKTQKRSYFNNDYNEGE